MVQVMKSFRDLGLKSSLIGKTLITFQSRHKGQQKTKRKTQSGSLDILSGLALVNHNFILLFLIL